MQLVNFYHRHNLHRLAKHSDLGSFELAIWLHTLAQALVWIFVPILLLKTGYPIRDVLIYYLIFNCIDVPLNFAVSSLMHRIGARKVIIIATLSIITFFILLGFLPPSNWTLLILLALLAAIYDTFFWIGHMYLFIDINKQGLDTGRSVGAIESVRKLANIAGPFAGALLLVFFGKLSLVVASAILFAASIVPLFRMKHVPDIPTERKLAFRKFFADRRERRDHLSMALWGIHNEVDCIIWPLFIFTLSGTIESVAAVPIIISLTSALFSYVAGRLTKRYAFSMLVIGSLTLSGLWILRILSADNFMLYVTVFLMGFFSLLVMIPLDGSITSGGLEKGPLAASTYRNVSSMILRIPLYIVLLFLLNIFNVSFVMAAISLFLILLLVFCFRRPQ